MAKAKKIAKLGAAGREGSKERLGPERPELEHVGRARFGRAPRGEKIVLRPLVEEDLVLGIDDRGAKRRVTRVGDT